MQIIVLFIPKELFKLLINYFYSSKKLERLYPILNLALPPNIIFTNQHPINSIQSVGLRPESMYSGHVAYLMYLLLYISYGYPD